MPVKFRLPSTGKYISTIPLIGGGLVAGVYLTLFILNPSESFLPILAIVGLSGLFILFIAIIRSIIRDEKNSRSRKAPPKQTAYSRHIPPQVKPTSIPLDELTKSLDWDWKCFRSVLINLANQGAGSYVSAHRRPNSVSLDGLSSTLDELRRISAQSQGRETSRAVFVDTGKSCLVISGKTHVGTKREVKIDMEAQPGRGSLQLPVLTIHVHPSQAVLEGLSDVDYISFLSDRRQIVMMICFQGGILFAMKTTATTTTISPETAQHMIATIRKDISKIWNNLYLPYAIVAFNKAVCLEFGMTLYQTSSPNENIASRVEVTNL